MDLKCPSCKREFDIGNAAAPRENMICPFCETVLFRAGDIAFMYGKNVPDRGDGKRRISCPYCQQKYVITDIPYHGLIGCQICLNIFSVPKPFLTKHSEQKIRISPPFSAKPPPAPDMPTVADSESFATASPFFSVHQPDSLEKTAPEDNVFRGLTIPGNEEDRTSLEKDFDDLEAPDLKSPEKPHPAATNGFSMHDMGCRTHHTGSSPEKKGGNVNVLCGGNAAMQVAMNVLWLILGGLIEAVLLVIAGLFFCVTVIGIPFGIQLFKLAYLYIAPFGSDIRYKNSEKIGCLTVGMNIIWIIFFGIAMAIGNFLSGVILCITVIGIPFGLQYFKFGKMMFAPFGVEVVRKNGLLIPLCTAGGVALLYLIVFSLLSLTA